MNGLRCPTCGNIARIDVLPGTGTRLLVCNLKPEHFFMGYFEFHRVEDSQPVGEWRTLGEYDCYWCGADLGPNADRPHYSFCKKGREETAEVEAEHRAEAARETLQALAEARRGA